MLVGEPGQVLFLEIDVQNQTKWPWKRGCYIGLANRDSNCPLTVKDYPIDQEVRGMQTVSLFVPIEIPSDFLNNKDSESQVIELPFAFFGPRQGAFGQQFTVKVQVKEVGEDEITLFRAAITLAEAGMGSFDECVDALRKCKLDENAALAMLVDLQKEAELYQ